MGPSDSTRQFANTSSANVSPPLQVKWGRTGDLTGRTFGWLEVLYLQRNEQGKIAWLCRCRCGKTKLVTSGSLVHGSTVSCGCYRRDSKVSRARQMLIPEHVRTERSRKAYLAFEKYLREGTRPPRNAGSAPRISDETARAIREDYQRGGVTMKALATRYDVCMVSVGSILGRPQKVSFIGPGPKSKGAALPNNTIFPGEVL